MKIVGIDVGGTFTDLMLFDSNTGKQVIHKLSTTHGAQEGAVISGLKQILSKEMIDPKTVDLVVHGTTIATNAMLERKGARACLITTKGMEDILEIGRQNREEIYSVMPWRPKPLIDAQNRIGINERLDERGNILHDLKSDEIDRVMTRVKSIDPDSVAVSLLFSYENPKHERMIIAKLEQNRDLYSIASSDVLPEFREYERTSTTALEAYLGPLVVSYVEKMNDSLSELLPNAKLAIMQSNGGTILASKVRGKAVGLAISGLAGGVIGGWEVAKQENITKAITLDMGGTSCDISAIRGKISIRANNEVGGLPLRIPSVDVKTIGAGGGSIAWIDEGGIMHVGPKSAGAEPGPAAYGNGGTSATVTDATLLTGRLNPKFFLGGRMELETRLAKQGISILAKSLGLSEIETALGIIRISTTNMVQAIREMTVIRGYDPREFVLIPFGGAGPTQAVDIADELGIREILIPPRPGITSAFGLLVADLRVDQMKTIRFNAIPENEKDALRVLSELSRTGISKIKAQGAKGDQITIDWSIDMRYEGQSHEIAVSVPYNTESLVDTSRANFIRRHFDEYGYTIGAGRIEWITARVAVTCPQAESELAEPWQIRTEERVEYRALHLTADEMVDARVQRRMALEEETEYCGPMIIEQEDTTIYIGPKWKAKQNTKGILHMKRCGS